MIGEGKTLFFFRLREKTWHFGGECFPVQNTNLRFFKKGAKTCSSITREEGEKHELLEKRGWGGKRDVLCKVYALILYLKTASFHESEKINLLFLRLYFNKVISTTPILYQDE